MNGPVIALDVSKGKSHAVAFLPGMARFGNQIVIIHGKEGFGRLSRLHASLREESGKEPSIVYESTGVYSSPVREFLVSGGFTAYEISPMLSAKVRKTEIRATKTDSMDPSTIAKAFYMSASLRKLEANARIYDDLRDQYGHYLHLLESRNREANRYLMAVDAAWPGFCDAVNPVSRAALAIVARFGHPSNVKTIKGTMSAIKDIPTGTLSREAFAKRVIGYAGSCSSGRKPGSAMARHASEMAKRVMSADKELKKAQDELISMAKSVPEFAPAASVPGIGDLLAARIVACVGDVSRFRSGDSLVAYAGIDPTVNSSGTRTGEHLSITRKGNRYLRCSLYLAVACICMHYPDSKIARFVSSKTKNGLCRKAAIVAGCSKLAGILYALMTNREAYKESL